MRETYPCWSGFICTAWPVTRGEMALQVCVQLSPTEHWPRQRNARRLGLKTAQHLLTDKGRSWNTLRVRGPCAFGGSFGPSKRCDCLRVHNTKSRKDTLARFRSNPRLTSVQLPGGECAWPRIAGFDGMVENKKLRAQPGDFTIQESPRRRQSPFNR